MKKTKTKSIQDVKNNCLMNNDTINSFDQNEKINRANRLHIFSMELDAISSMAMKGDYDSLHCLWLTALRATKYIHDIAVKTPAMLQPIAQDTATMPYLRSIHKTYASDFDEIAEKIMLGKNLPIKEKTKARFNLPYANFAATAILHIEQQRNILIDEISNKKQLSHERRINLEHLRKIHKAKYGKYWQLNKLPDLNKSTIEKWLPLIAIECGTMYDEMKSELPHKTTKRNEKKYKRLDYRSTFLTACEQAVEGLAKH